MTSEHDEERFAFGRNWAGFLSVLNEARIGAAEATLRNMLETDSLGGKRFLDIGSGSGLVSLASRRLGAEVVSFDLDPQSVACTAELKRRFFRGDPAWRVDQGSVLDVDYLRSLGRFDIVYSWGVLHHTGRLWRALENALVPVAPRGHLYIAIYNHQEHWSRVWAWIKRTYVRLPRGLRFVLLVPCLVRIWGPALTLDVLRGRGLRRWRGYAEERGMSPWHDVVDWVGGHPFEVAKPEEVFDFCRARGFTLRRLKTCGGGRGCNEFVFQRDDAAS